MPLCFGKVMLSHGGSLHPTPFGLLPANGHKQRLKTGSKELWQNSHHHVTLSTLMGTTFRSSKNRFSHLYCKARAEEHKFDVSVGAASRETLSSSHSEDAVIVNINEPSPKSAEGDSNLEVQLVEATVGHSETTGSVFGAVALITGSSVGAGILALPAITAPAGFVPTTAVMGISWGFLLLEALLLAEVNVELMRKREPGQELHSQVLSLRTMADETMGPLGGLFTTVIYLMLSYTLLVAYISKSGEVLSVLFNVSNRTVADVVFTVGFGSLLGIGGAKMADSVNQVLTVMLLGFFVLIVLGGVSIADWKGLEHVDWAVAPQTIPIILLALVYHDLTPVVCAQLGGDIARIRISLVLGSLVPLAMFLSWDAVALCLAPLSGSTDPINEIIRIGGPGPAFVVETFALLAVATSFIGTVLGLSEFLLEQLGRAQGLLLEKMSNQRKTPSALSEWLDVNGPRALSFFLVLAPPLAASSLVTDAFYSASDLAGAYGMTSLYGVIPPIMAWSLLNSSNDNIEETSTVQYSKDSRNMSLLGGRIFLATVGACAVAVIAGQVALDLYPPVRIPASTTTAVPAKFDQEGHTSLGIALNPQLTTIVAPSIPFTNREAFLM